MSFWEVAQGLGAAVGFVTGVVVFYDRATREWPVFIFESQERPDGEMGRRLVLRVQNKSLRALEVRIRNRAPGIQFGLLKDFSTNSVIRERVEDFTDLLIAGDTFVDFPVKPPEQIGSLHEDYWVPLEIKWRFAQPARWLPWRTRRIHLSSGAFKKMSFIW